MPDNLSQAYTKSVELSGDSPLIVAPKEFSLKPIDPPKQPVNDSELTRNEQILIEKLCDARDDSFERKQNKGLFKLWQYTSTQRLRSTTNLNAGMAETYQMDSPEAVCSHAKNDGEIVD